jgi:hypothetical protein
MGRNTSRPIPLPRSIRSDALRTRVASSTRSQRTQFSRSAASGSAFAARRAGM